MNPPVIVPAVFPVLAGQTVPAASSPGSAFGRTACAPPQRRHVPTASRRVPFASGNRPANRSSGAVCSLTSARLISAIPSIKASARISPRSTCLSLDSHSAVSSGDLILSGRTVIRFTPFSVGRSCFFFRSTNPTATSFSSVAAQVAGVPKPLRSAWPRPPSLAPALQGNSPCPPAHPRCLRSP